MTGALTSAALDGALATFAVPDDDVALPDDQQPRDTRLERAVLDPLAAGRHWQLGRGWIRGPLA